MNKRKYGASIAIILGGLSACSTLEETELDNIVEQMSACEKVHALLQGHKKGFPALRTQQSTVKYMDIWRAKYHLVGDACQVWGWGQGKFSYVCSLIEPNKDVAMVHFNSAKEKTQACLGPDWKVSEGPRPNGEGEKIEFTNAGKSTVLTILAASSATLFKTEWRTYYFVGDPSDKLNTGK